MTEKISNELESKTVEVGGSEAVRHETKRNDAGEGSTAGNDGGEERWKRERWTRHESMTLVSAMKQLEEDASATSTGGDAKWKSISHICSSRAVQRTGVQCRKRWNTLLAAYKKIKDSEKLYGMGSYWLMGGPDCRVKKLPAGFDEEIWNVMNSFLAGRAGTSPRLFPYKAEDPSVDPIPATAVKIDAVVAVKIDPVTSPQSDNQVDQNDKEDDPSKKRKHVEMQETCVPDPEPETPVKPQKDDDQNAGTERRYFESLDPFTRFLSSFMEKSLEAYERNSELNRNLRREQGENLVAVLGNLSSAVRDLGSKFGAA